MAKRRKVGNLLALAVLSVLAGGIPMHPYQLANVLKRTGKDREMKIKWGSLYTVVQNLERHGFIKATSSDREGRRPERTTYAITDAGREEMCDWIRELVGDPEWEPPPFEAALSVVGVLGPDETQTLLRRRTEALEAGLATDRAALAEVAATVPRLFLIEEEYALAMREAEARWVRSLLAELEAGTMPGMAQWREYHQSGEMSAEWARLLSEEGGPADGD
jgi:DNA-binding PadR family transcriptional regulator